jgi:hypothetical protein
MKFDISYTCKEITPWMECFFKTNVTEFGFLEIIEQNLDLPQVGSILFIL